MMAANAFLSQSAQLVVAPPGLRSRLVAALYAEKLTPLASRRRSRQVTTGLSGGGLPHSSTALNGLQTKSTGGTSSSSSSSSNNDKNNKNNNNHRCNELEFEMHVGKAMDTLRKDYADVFVKAPDFSIYCKEMEFVDPSGVHVNGLRSYQNAHRLLHTIIKFLYCPEKSSITSARMCYDPVKHNIRVSWNAEVVPREIFGGTRSILHVDGISVYEFNRATGEIVQHRVEYLVMNNQAVQPKEGLVAALQQYHGVTVPSSCCQFDDDSLKKLQEKDLFNVPFAVFKPNQESLLAKDSRSTLKSFEASRSDSGDNSDASALSSSSSAAADGVNWEALERKNKSRKKFGLAPLTPEEFLKLESKVKVMDAEQQMKRQQQQAAAAAAQAQEEKRNKKARVLDKLFGNVLKDTCETNYDCTRPEVCCDFGFKKMCCSSGSPVLGLQPAYVPVPVETADYPGQPPSRY
ncbi:hypothetical protein ACA910_018282 [Epithemia clementina (nom. ined.)]